MAAASDARPRMLAPERRKAEAVRRCLMNELSPLCPASILRRHPDVELYLDADSASLLPRSM